MQLEEGTREVRHGPTGADTRPRKERRGRRTARARAHEGGREGKEKGGGVAVMGRPFTCDAVGGGGRSMGGATRL
jgi:hypothetical protein